MAVGIAASFPISAEANQKVRFAYNVQIHMANMMRIQDHAKKCGVEVEAFPLRRYADIQLALTTNRVDMAAMGYVNVALMEENNHTDYVAIGGVFTGGQGLVIRSDVEVNNWKDLEGKTLGTAPNSYVELLLKTTAVLNGVDWSKVNTVSFTTGGPPAVMALRDKQVDGFAMWEPTNADAVVAGTGVYSKLDIGANDTGHVNGLMLANADFAAKNEEIVNCMVAALVASTDELNKDEKLYRETAQRGTGASTEVLDAAMPQGEMDYRMYQQRGRALLKMMHEAGLTKTDTSDAIDRTFDYRYLMATTGKSKHELGGE